MMDMDCWMSEHTSTPTHSLLETELNQAKLSRLEPAMVACSWQASPQGVNRSKCTSKNCHFRNTCIQVNASCHGQRYSTTHCPLQDRAGNPCSVPKFLTKSKHLHHVQIQHVETPTDMNMNYIWMNLERLAGFKGWVNGMENARIPEIWSAELRGFKRFWALPEKIRPSKYAFV